MSREQEDEPEVQLDQNELEALLAEQNGSTKMHIGVSQEARNSSDISMCNDQGREGMRAFVDHDDEFHVMPCRGKFLRDGIQNAVIRTKQRANECFSLLQKHFHGGWRHKGPFLFRGLPCPRRLRGSEMGDGVVSHAH